MTVDGDRSWLDRITRRARDRVRRWRLARRGWPAPSDLDAMSDREFDDYVEHIGFDARIKRAIAQADSDAETSTDRQLPVR